MANARRRAILRIMPQLLGEFVRNGERHFLVEGGVPKDAKFIRAQFNNRRGYFDVVFESVTFDPVADGAKMPILPVPVHKILFPFNKENQRRKRRKEEQVEI